MRGNKQNEKRNRSKVILKVQLQVHVIEMKTVSIDFLFIISEDVNFELVPTVTSFSAGSQIHTNYLLIN